MTKTTWCAVGMIALSFLIDPFAAMIYPNYNYWIGPSFYMLRLGLVLLLCFVMYIYERKRGVSPRSVVSLVGRESLLVYTAHLMLVYGKFGYFTFTDRVNQSFGYGEAIVTMLILIGMTVPARDGWSRVKSSPPRVKRIIQGSSWPASFWCSFFGPTDVFRQ